MRELGGTLPSLSIIKCSGFSGSTCNTVSGILISGNNALPTEAINTATKSASTYNDCICLHFSAVVILRPAPASADATKPSGMTGSGSGSSSATSFLAFDVFTTQC
ncbi:MAG: hypothetical protein A3F13_09770 [Gammaproteobacteria bacterium RIFCSPHIGHO2_12_FULL_40_19]|nr:MAG: hypothetical protein A3F13_09770 [Gammaproteobacteria bacterium RIFCSPHIGHO2_12_FULL_40_19]